MTATDPIHVLHVDDEADFAEMAATFLEREDDRMAVRTATGADEGMAVLTDHEVDCVVSDYDMPGRDGIAFLEAVREEHPDLPVLLFTGKGSEEVASEAISAGVTDYLQKESGTEQYAILANRIANAVDGARAEREVRRTREYFGTILEHASDYVMIANGEGEVEYISPAVERVMGYPPEELVGIDAFEPIHPDDMPVAMEALSEVLENPGEEHSVEYRARHADGSWLWLEVRGRNLLDDPVIGGILVSARDITDRKEREEELERQNDLFAKAQDIANVGAWEYGVRAGEAFLTEEVYAIHGLSADAEIGPEESLEFYHPEDRPTIRDAFQRAVENGDSYDLEVRLVDDDGDQRWVRTRGDPQLEDGEVVRVRGTIQDITDRKRRERELEELGEALETVLENVPMIFFSFDEDGVFTRSRGRALERLGLDSGEVVGQSVFELFEEFPDILDHCERALDGEQVTATVEVDDLTFESWYQPLYEDGDVVKVVGHSYDISELRRREQELERQNEQLDQFASVVSHDLRNPLALAEGRLELAREECGSDHLDAIGDALDRMWRIVEDVLWLAREGRDIGSTETVHLGDAMETAWTVVADGVDGAELIGADGESLQTIAADYDRLCQLLENVFRNAVEHGSTSPPPSDEDAAGSVTVTVGELDGGFYIEDDGPGIPPDERDDVFETGYSTSADGTGFGLNIVRRIAGAHGWEVRVTGGSEGGARFEITGVEDA